MTEPYQNLKPLETLDNDTVAKSDSCNLVVQQQCKAIRKTLGYSQTEVAKLLNITQPTVCAFENSKEFTIEGVKRYFEAMGCKFTISIELPHGETLTFLESQNAEITP